jgi:hypothetical protein
MELQVTKNGHSVRESKLPLPHLCGLQSSCHHLYKPFPARGKTIVVCLTLIRQEHLASKLSHLLYQNLVLLVCQCCWDRVDQAGNCRLIMISLKGLKGAVCVSKLEILVRVFKHNCAVSDGFRSVLRVGHATWIQYDLVANISTAGTNLIKIIVEWQ